MDWKETKSIDIVAFLQRMGHHGTTDINGMVWLCSPFREEKTASFRVDTTLNRWKDFGTGQNGDLVDLVQLIYNTDSVGAKRIIEDKTNGDSFSFSRASITPSNKGQSLFIIKVQTLEHVALLQYLHARKIPLSISNIYLKEVHYLVNKRHYFSIGFENDKGGFELRNASYKSCTSPKFLTYFPVYESRDVNLFEGFLDALSLLAIDNKNRFSENTIVLNSLTNLNYVLPLLYNYEKINLYLDNDTAGQEAAKLIKSLYQLTDDKAQTLYLEYKDLNDFLTGKRLT